MSTVDKYQDILDSRDVDSRIEELEAERDAAAEAGTDFVDCQELAALVAFRDEAEGYCSDWRYGATLVRDSYFQDYAQELADDIGALGKDTQWPHTCIDWDQAARELRADYSSAELDGVTYWFRG
jgi:antirestriction protein